MEAAYPTSDAESVGRPGHSPLSDWAVQRLRDDIFTGTLPPGTPLREQGVTDRLGISRSPAREALKELESQGLIVTNPLTGRRTVASFDISDTYALFTIRCALEATAAIRAAERTSVDLVRRLEALQDEMEQMTIRREEPRRRDFEVDFDLHRQICDAADMPRLRATLDPLWAQTHSLLRALFNAGVYGDEEEDTAAFRDHRKIIAAIAAGDSAAAEREMRSHLDGRRDALIAALESRFPEGDSA